jgi:DNA invertase Pin-like site-specific DNA recombinase
MLMVHIIGAFAEFERAIIRERTMAGLAYARSQGRVGGRPRKNPSPKNSQIIKGENVNQITSV